MRAIRYQDAIFFNVSPAPHTQAILEMQGFRRFAAGRIIAAPALNRSLPGVRVRAVDPADRSGPDLDQAEIDLLRRDAVHRLQQMPPAIRHHDETIR